MQVDSQTGIPSIELKNVLFIKVGRGLSATEVLESRDAQRAKIQGREGFDKTKGRMSPSAGHMGASKKTTVIATNIIL